MLADRFVVCYSTCMSIRCGHCKATHETISEVRECSVRHLTPSGAANRLVATVQAALSAPAAEDPAWARVDAQYAPQAPQERSAGTLAEEGVYRVGAKIFRVVTKEGRRFAEEMVRGKFVYAKGMVYRLHPGQRMSLEEAQAWGRREVRCVRCGTPLEKKESREAGIGPVCATKI